MKRIPLCKKVHWVLRCQISRIQNLTDIWKRLGGIISCPQIDLTLLLEFIPLHTNFNRTVCPESDTKILRACNSLNPDQTRPKGLIGDAPNFF